MGGGDPGRRFDDLFNLVFDPATLLVAFDRVAGNRGAKTAGVDGMTVAMVDERVGVRGFLEDLRAQLKSGAFRPLPVRQRMIFKPGGSGKLRKLGIPAVADPVVQAALKLVLVKAFLKAGIMTESGRREDSDTGTPQGGILSPLLANIALSVLDEHVMAPGREDPQPIPASEPRLSEPAVESRVR